MTDRTMVDSSTFADVPTNADIACAYIDGNLGVATQAQFEARFPHSKYGHCYIDVNGSNPAADVRDWETGDKGGNLEQWVIKHNQRGTQNLAVVYCNRATIGEVRQLTGSQILNKDYFLWIATLDGTIYRAEGVIACQDEGSAQTRGHYDQSVVFDDRFWRAIGTPTPKPTVPSTKPNCTSFQKAVRVEADNLWGPDTDKAALTLANAGSRTFPNGVQFAQKVVGVKQDGIWGPESQAALKDTVAMAQRALNTMGFNTNGVDGLWGKNTNAAYTKARTACHI